MSRLRSPDGLVHAQVMIDSAARWTRCEYVAGGARWNTSSLDTADSDAPVTCFECLQSYKHVEAW